MLTPLSKDPADGRKVKGVIHWVSASHALPIEIRLYDRLFSVPNQVRRKTSCPLLTRNRWSLSRVTVSRRCRLRLQVKRSSLSVKVTSARTVVMQRLTSWCLTVPLVCVIRGLKRANKSQHILSKRRFMRRFFAKNRFQAPFAERINYMSVIMESAECFTFK